MNMTSDAFDRAAELDRIARRLRDFDDKTLAELDRLTDESTYLVADPESAAVPDRVVPVPDHMSPAPSAGGAIVVGNAAPGHAIADGPARRPTTGHAIDGAPSRRPTVERSRPERAGTDMERRRLLAGGAAIGAAAVTGAFALRGGGEDSARAESSRMTTIIDLYQQLDRLDLDGRLRSAMALILVAISAVRTAAGALEAGVDAVGRALDVAEAALVPIRDGLARLEVMVGRLGGAFERLAAAVAERAEPVAEAVGGVLEDALNFLPPAIAVPVREGLDALRMLVDMVPAAVAAAQDDLILPLRTTWLPVENGGTPGIHEELFVPLRERVLGPGRDLVAQLRAFEATWSESVDPLESVLVQRAAVRARIDELAA